MTLNSSDAKQSPALAPLVTSPPTTVLPSTTSTSLPAQQEDLPLPTRRPSHIRSRSSYLRRSTTSNSSSRTSTSATTSTRSIEGSSRRSNTSRKSRKQAQAGQAEDAAAAQLELNRRLASLQLPHMPASILTGGANSPSQPPTIRILVVADIDLESVSALAESALQDMPQENPLQRVDLCIACGPFCHEDDLRHYYQGRQRRRHAARHGASYHAKTRSTVPIQVWRGGGGVGNTVPPFPAMPQQSASCFHNTSHSHSKQSTYSAGPTSSYPYKRTREETAALEGLMTAALSQLESIVCRVLFVPGKSDPISTITSSSTSLAYTKERRLTPNSRNIHQHWIPLCPGLGCAGLLYVDGQKLQQQPPPLEDDDEGIEDDDVTDSSHLLPEDSSFSYDRDENAASVPCSTISSTQLPVPSLQKSGTNYGVASYEEQVKQYGYDTGKSCTLCRTALFLALTTLPVPFL